MFYKINAFILSSVITNDVKFEFKYNYNGRLNFFILFHGTKWDSTGTDLTASILHTIVGVYVLTKHGPS